MTYMTLLSPGLVGGGNFIAPGARDQLQDLQLIAAGPALGFGHARLRPVLPDRTGGRGAHRALDAARDPRAGADRQPPLQRHPARSPADVVLAAEQAPTPARACGNRGAPTAPGRQ